MAFTLDVKLYGDNITIAQWLVKEKGHWCVWEGDRLKNLEKAKEESKWLLYSSSAMVLVKMKREEKVEDEKLMWNSLESEDEFHRDDARLRR